MTYLLDPKTDLEKQTPLVRDWDDKNIIKEVKNQKGLYN